MQSGETAFFMLVSSDYKQAIATEAALQRQVDDALELSIALALRRYGNYAFEYLEGLLLMDRRRPHAEGPKKRTIGAKLRWAVFKRDGFKCLRCDSNDDLSVDHITAESNGGTLEMANLQTLCRSCNSKKGKRG